MVYRDGQLYTVGQVPDGKLIVVQYDSDSGKSSSKYSPGAANMVLRSNGYLVFQDGGHIYVHHIGQEKSTQSFRIEVRYLFLL